MKQRLKRLLRTVAIAAAIALVLCEIGLRVLIASTTASARPLSALEHRLDFMVDKRYVNADGQDATRDLTTPGYTVHNNERGTTDQPAQYDRTVWMYGSSTVFGAYVNDKDTISSYLQREFNRRGRRWRVVNMAQPALNVTLEDYWLTKSTIKPGDMIIFIDGAVDLNNIIRDSHKAWAKDVFACQIANVIPSAIIALWCSESVAGRAPQQYIDAEMTFYWRGLAKGQKYAQAHGAEFVHFLQPAMPHDGDLYAVMGVGQLSLVIDAVDYYDELHYTPNAHAQIAAQIAAALNTGLFSSN